MKYDLQKFQRVFCIVLDGVGVGALPDASDYGDEGANTLRHVSERFPAIQWPTLRKMGLGNLTPMPACSPITVQNSIASFGKCAERSYGKDTTSGHWEMTGVTVQKPFPTFPNGFPEDLLNAWVQENNLPGFLGNKAASGTEIITELGEEHMKTLKPIVYTSADSVWQIAAHETQFGLERLYQISESARKWADQLQIARVIARPFLGTQSKIFHRTPHRKDFSMPPIGETMMESLWQNHRIPTIGIGKIKNIFNGKGIQNNIDTVDNRDGLNKSIEYIKSNKDNKYFLFINLIDFDMLYGHRRDPQGFMHAMQEFDAFLPKILQEISPTDLLCISADHGNDPTFKGTDHTREYVPMLVYSPSLLPRDLGIRGSFADVGQTIYHAFTGDSHHLAVGQSCL